MSAGHAITFKITHGGDLSFTVRCPHDGEPTSCGTMWTERGHGPCRCIEDEGGCEACFGSDEFEPDHYGCHNCDESSPFGPGCESDIVDECWYASQADNIGGEAFNFGSDGISFRVPVEFHGGGDEEVIDVKAVAVWLTNGGGR